MRPKRKIYIEVIHEDRDVRKRPLGTYLSHIDCEVCDTFIRVCKVGGDEFPLYLSQWTKHDFNLELDFTMHNHIRILRELVLDRYKQIYPVMYYSEITDTNGWMRVWITDKMRKEIKKHDTRAYQKLFRSA